MKEYVFDIVTQSFQDVYTDSATFSNGSHVFFFIRNSNSIAYSFKLDRYTSTKVRKESGNRNIFTRKILYFETAGRAVDKN